MKLTKRNLLGWGIGVALLVALLAIFAIGCAGTPGPAGERGPAGPAGAAGPSGASTGTIAGKVTNTLTGAGVSGVSVTTDPAVQGVTITTGADGAYSGQLPVGVYTLSFKKANFDAATQTASVVAGQTITKNVALKPTKAVAVNAGADAHADPQATVTLKAAAEPLDGSTVQTYEWTQTKGVALAVSGSGDTITVTLASPAAYKAELIKNLKPLDRVYVLGLNPHALEAAETSEFKVTVKTSSGTYSGTVNVAANLPYKTTLGIENVPTGIPVVVNGKNQASYEWTITLPPRSFAGAVPVASAATLSDAGTRNPVFTPDIPGKYTLKENKSGATVDIYAGTWAGAISGLDAKGRPASAGCTICHDGKIAADKFTPWKNSGHAEIFTQNLNTSATYNEGCFTCHTVGYDKEVNNSGSDDAADFADFLKGGIMGKPNPNNFADMLQKFSKTASLANIQCESCHGPNNSALHANGTLDASRINISSELCGSCHGEPPRHGRFQQWEESGHAGGSATTPERGVTNAHCGRCHSGQGFLAWIKQGDLTKSIQGARGNATAAEMAALGMTADKIQPITCVTCHDPHAQGTTSGEPTSATVRIQDITPLLPAGFQAQDVGKGALCITCHNTRNAVHDIDAPPTSYSAPHTAAQADVLMGENAYFISVPQRSPHSLIKDTCVTCHMEESPPPAEFSYNRSGTNHSFEASTAICGSCHSPLLNAKALEAGVEDKLHQLAKAMGKYLISKMPASVVIKDYTPHTFDGKSYDVLSDPLEVSKADIVSAEPTEPHGQQGYFLTFRTPKTFVYRPAGETPHTVAVTVAEVRLGDIIGAGGVAVIPVTDKLVQVGWNFFLVEGDGSEGIHNPAFVNALLDASIVALR